MSLPGLINLIIKPQKSNSLMNVIYLKGTGCKNCSVQLILDLVPIMVLILANIPHWVSLPERA